MANSANSISIPYASSAQAGERQAGQRQAGERQAGERQAGERVESADHASAASPLTLSAIAVGVTARVVALDLDDELRAWISAVGISEGERVTVLRRAIFGGPIHVRTGAGGEFALNRQLAKSIVLSYERAHERAY